MPNNKPEGRLSFDSVASTYDRARPEYPAEAFDGLFDYLRSGLSVETPDVIEIGPGTGQATRSLLALGARVTAVEIGPNLADFMRQKFAGEAGLRVINAAFEDADLLPETYDMVFAATSFHWLDQDVRVRKAVELLRPGGVLATLSTVQIKSEVDRGYFDRTFEIYRRYRPDERYTAGASEEYFVPNEYEEFQSSGLLTDVTLRKYRWDQTYSTDAYERLLRSYSDMQMMEPAGREGLISDLRYVIDTEYDGKVVRPLVIALTLGRRRRQS